MQILFITLYDIKYNVKCLPLEQLFFAVVEGRDNVLIGGF